MAVPATLFFAVQRIAGSDANDLLDWMNGVEANRSELRELVSVYSSDAKSASDALRADMRADFVAFRDEMHQEFGRVRAEMRAGFADVDMKFAAVREEMRVGFARQDTLRAELASTLIKWMFVFWATSLLATLGLILPRL